MPEPLPITDAEKSWVDAMITAQRARYDETIRLIDRLRKLRFMRLNARPPRAFQRFVGRGIRSPLSYRLVQTVSGMVSRDRPTFERVPRDRRDRDGAVRLTNSADPLLQAFEAAARRPLFRLSIDQAVGDGRTIWKVRRTPWEGYPLKGDTESDKDYNRRVAEWVVHAPTQPIRATLVDPMNFLPSREEWDTSFVIEQGQRSTLQTLKTLRLTPGAGGLEFVPEDRAFPVLETPSGFGNTIPVEEVWTKEYVYIRINNGQTFKYPNEYGFIPYAWSAGEVSSHNDPSLEGLSAIFPMHSLEPWLQTMLGILASWSIIGGTPILTTTYTPGSPSVGSDVGAVAELPLGKHVTLGPGGSMAFVAPPPVGREVLEFVRLLLDFIDRAGITPLASGVIGTRTPGLTFSAALEAAAGKLLPLKENLEYIFAEVVRMSWRITYERIKQPIYVNGTGLVERSMLPGRRTGRGRFIIDPKDIDGYYDLSCTLKLDTLQDEIAKGSHAAFMKAHGLWSRRHGMRYSGVDDPDQELEDMAVEELEETPMVKAQIVQRALQESPELQQIGQELQAQGVDIVALLSGMPQPGEEAGGGSAAAAAGGLFGGAPQPRGAPAPQAGGRSAGSPRGPGGQRRARQRRTTRP